MFSSLRLTLKVWKQNAAMKAIANYLLSLTSTNDSVFHSTLESLFSQSEAHIGLVLCERLVNMPVPVIPPMYKMLADEVKWAIADVRSLIVSFISASWGSDFGFIIPGRTILLHSPACLFPRLSPFGGRGIGSHWFCINTSDADSYIRFRSPNQWIFTQKAQEAPRPRTWGEWHLIPSRRDLFFPSRRRNYSQGIHSILIPSPLVNYSFRTQPSMQFTLWRTHTNPPFLLSSRKRAQESLLDSMSEDGYFCLKEEEKNWGK